jgi:nucleotide-binding universal stress UspA family protein
MSDQNRYVVVGVDGSKDGLIALDWAVDAAARRRWALRVVHVVDEEETTELAPAMVRMLVPDDGSEVIEDAAAELARLGAGTGRLELRHGYPADVLLQLGRDGGLLVVGRRGMEGFAELAVGSVSQVCAAMAEVPVVVVPDRWSPGGPPIGRVAVGVDESASCLQALDFAFEEAASRSATVVAVRAIKVPDVYPAEDHWPNPDAPPWSPAVETRTAELLSSVRERYPDVLVETRIIQGHPVQILAAVSLAADLVVVGGLGRRVFSPLRMGSVSRGLLDHAACPVAVIHQTPNS